MEKHLFKELGKDVVKQNTEGHESLKRTLQVETKSGKVEIPLDRASEEIESVLMKIGFDVGLEWGNLVPKVNLTLIETSGVEGRAPYMDQVSLFDEDAPQHYADHFAKKYNLTDFEKSILLAKLTEGRSEGIMARRKTF